MIAQRVFLSRGLYLSRKPGRRCLVTLAIETSCDDTSVAVLETSHVATDTNGKVKARLHFHDKVTADNQIHRGIEPITSIVSHHRNISALIQKAIETIPNRKAVGHVEHTTKEHVSALLGQAKPDFVTVTRGPGLAGSLATGICVAKGLTLSWGVPLVGVHHMQAHLLTPGLVAALNDNVTQSSPQYPFLTLLVSGGHSMLLKSSSLFDHKIVGNTVDQAVGNSIDQLAREVLPPDILKTGSDVNYGRLLEAYVFGDIKSPAEYNYAPPRRRHDEITPQQSRWGWEITPPLISTTDADRAKLLRMTFTGVNSAVNKLMAKRQSITQIDDEERRALGKEAMRILFEHIAIVTVDALRQLEFQSYAKGRRSNSAMPKIKSLVVSGGVAANKYLRTILRYFLDARGYSDVKIYIPPPALCTDNAAMIAWTGVQMYEAGYSTSLDFLPTRKWSLDPAADEGGILGVDSWIYSERQKMKSQGN